jgi:hypothetical protein
MAQSQFLSKFESNLVLAGIRSSQLSKISAYGTETRVWSLHGGEMYNCFLGSEGTVVPMRHQVPNFGCSSF